MPKFSVILPTYRRIDTLEHSLKTAVAQTYQDIEIIVHDAGQSADVADMVARIGDRRTRYVSYPHESMQSDWERAIDASSGDYILCVGDDDGLLPDACAVAAKILADTGLEVLNWHPITYFWPQFPLENCRNRIIASWGPNCYVDIRSSREFINDLFRFKPANYPGIYHGITKRSVINRVRAATGRYMLGLAPDVSSAVANMCFVKHYGFINRPLSINALSHNSYFYRCFLATDDLTKDQSTQEAFSGGVIHNTLVDTPNLAVFLAKDMLALKEHFPDHLPAFSYRSLLAYAHCFLPLDAARRRRMVADLARLAALHQIDVSGIPHETFSWLVMPAPSGRHANPALEVVDTEVAREGVTNVAEAVEYCSKIIPDFPGFVARGPSENCLVAVLSGEQPLVLSFTDAGNGRAFLGQGWGVPESWGIWSTAGWAEIVVPLHNYRSLRSLKVRLKGHRFVHSNMPEVTGCVRIDGRRMATLDATLQHPQIDIEFLVPSDVYANDGELRLELLFDNPKSPAEVGANADHRKLCFGLHEVVITATPRISWRNLWKMIRKKALP